MAEEERIFMDRRGTDSSKVKNDIEMKVLKGIYTESVPTIRKISEDYGIGTTTASEIMRSLVKEGVLYSIQGKGFFVVPYCIPLLTKKHTERLCHKLEELYDYSATLGVDFIKLAKMIAEKKSGTKKSE